MTKTPQYYPSVRYHRTEAPRTIQDPAEDAALGPGWHKSPDDCLTDDEKAAKYAHMPIAPPVGGLDPSTQAPFRRRYPSTRYRVVKGQVLETRVVQDQSESDGLGPDWYPTPAPTAADLAPPSPPPPSKPLAEITDAAKTPPAIEDEAEAERAAELHGMTAKEIVAALADVTDVAVLQRVKAREAQNPKGARKGVLKYLDERLDARS